MMYSEDTPVEPVKPKKSKTSSSLGFDKIQSMLSHSDGLMKMLGDSGKSDPEVNALYTDILKAGVKASLKDIKKTLEEAV